MGRYFATTVVVGLSVFLVLAVVAFFDTAWWMFLQASVTYAKGALFFHPQGKDLIGQAGALRFLGTLVDVGMTWGLAAMAFAILFVYARNRRKAESRQNSDS